MASLTQWTWVWASCGRWWRIGKPGVLQSTGLQRAGHDWVNSTDRMGNSGYFTWYTGTGWFRSGASWQQLLWGLVVRFLPEIFGMWPYNRAPQLHPSFGNVLFLWPVHPRTFENNAMSLWTACVHIFLVMPLWPVSFCGKSTKTYP